MLKITEDIEIEDLYDTSGVYAYFKSGYMTDDEGCIKDHKKDAIGVVVIANVDGELHRIVVDKTDINDQEGYYGGLLYGDNDMIISVATIATDEATAFKDMNGKANTIAISDACHGYDDGYRTGSAAEDCQTRLNGNGYLPSLGELDIIYNRKDDINRIISLIDGDVMNRYYWTSTLYNETAYTWIFDWSNRYIGVNKRLLRYSVRAAMEI